MQALTWPPFCHNGILEFANGKLRHKNVSSICWRQRGFAGNRLWRAEKLWRTCMSVTLVRVVTIGDVWSIDNIIDNFFQNQYRYRFQNWKSSSNWPIKEQIGSHSCSIKSAIKWEKNIKNEKRTAFKSVSNACGDLCRQQNDVWGHWTSRSFLINLLRSCTMFLLSIVPLNWSTGRLNARRVLYSAGLESNMNIQKRKKNRMPPFSTPNEFA